ncbi:MAG: ParA family partition ATPase [Pseudomonadota bacterium]
MARHVITVAQQKGGAGKTTIAANLAVAFSANGMRTAILDTDPQGSLGRWFMTRCDRMGDDEVDLGFRTASAWGARYETRQLLREHDMVVIDTPPKMGYDGRPAIEVADLVVVPVTPSQIDVWATEPTIEMAQSEGKPFLTVLNRASARTRLTAETLKTIGEFGGLTAETMIGDRVLFAETMGTGYGAIEKRANGPAALEIRALTDEVAKLIR